MHIVTVRSPAKRRLAFECRRPGALEGSKSFLDVAVILFQMAVLSAATLGA